MENYLSYILVLSSFLYFIFITLRTWTKPRPKLPPGPRKLPLIGNLHNLSGGQPHHVLARLAEKYGPMMHIQIGEVPTVIISSPEGAREVMKTYDSNFCERPPLYAAQALTYNFKDLAFSRGEYAKQIRKITALEMLNPKRVQSFRGIREDETSNLIRAISSKAGEPVNLMSLLYNSSLSIVSRAAIGGKSKYHEAFKEVLPEIGQVFTGFNLVDVYPSINLLHVIHAMMPKNKRLAQKVDEVLSNIVDEHRARKSKGNKEDEVGADDFVQVLLDIQDRGDLEVPLSTESVKAITMNMLAGAGDTSAVVVEWAMTEMIRNPDVMAKTQAELRQAFGGEGEIDETRLADLRYFNAVIKETLRIHPAAPLLLPRECQESCRINGYDIPAKTRVMINAYSIFRNEKYWGDDALEFHPERFFESSLNYRGAEFHYIPFGSGRRMCPGISFGLANVEFTLANLLFHFDWKLPTGTKPQDLDMSERFGASLQKRDNLYLVPIITHGFGVSK